MPRDQEPREVVDNADNEVSTVDPKTGLTYVRCRQEIRRGREMSREWFYPDGTTVCRYDVDWVGMQVAAIRITKGSLDAVVAQNPAYLPPETRAQIEAFLVYP